MYYTTNTLTQIKQPANKYKTVAEWLARWTQMQKGLG